MALIVTGVGSLIHVYSIGYMKDDKSYARYFAYLNLFLFFMLMLVLGKSLLVLFVGWEGVGLASYLLIGFWFEDPDKARAGKKAFITNRIGDAGFLLGMFVLYQAFGTLDMVRINGAFMSGPAARRVGEPRGHPAVHRRHRQVGADSAPRLAARRDGGPDAGVRADPRGDDGHRRRVSGRPPVRHLHARAGGERASSPPWASRRRSLPRRSPIVQTDIKKVLAYSTISQLGFMFVALGVGAYGVAIFHLYTHAFFKACLFLAAGSVIHAMGGEQDIRKMGGLARKIPVTFVTFAVATAAIAGIPPLVRLLLEGRNSLVRVRQQPRRLAAALCGRGGHGAAHVVLHVPPAVAHVFRRAADDGRKPSITSTSRRRR